MTAVIVPFETSAEKEDRLYKEVISAFAGFSALQARGSLEAVERALDRLVAFQTAPSRPAARSRRPTRQDLARG